MHNIQITEDKRVKEWSKEYKVYFVTISGFRYWLRPLKRSEYLDMIQIRELGIEDDIEMPAIRKVVLNYTPEMEAGQFEERAGVVSTLYSVISEISGFVDPEIGDV